MAYGILVKVGKGWLGGKNLNKHIKLKDFVDPFCLLFEFFFGLWGRVFLPFLKGAFSLLHLGEKE